MDKKYMKMALRQAQKAYANMDIPVGVVIVKDGEVIARAFNRKHTKKDPTCHAEILAIKKACKKINDFRLEGADVYVTLEPCLMCYGALLSARVKRIIFGAYDKRFGILDLQKHIQFNHNAEVMGGMMEQECVDLLSKFFADLRRQNANNSRIRKENSEE